MPEPEQPAAQAAGAPSDDASKPVADPSSSADPASGTVDAGDEGNDDGEGPEIGDVIDDFGAPFIPKTFGGAFVWAKGEGFVTTVLRIKEGKSVPVATQNRRDMHVMLTGGRAVLEVDDGTEVDRVELMPAGPLLIDPANRYRLIAMTEVEIFTVYTQV